MGLEAVLAVLLDRERVNVGGSQLLALLAIANFTDDHGIANVELATIAHWARIGDRRTQQVLRELEDEALIEIVPGSGRGHYSRYRLLVDVSGAREFSVRRRKVKEREKGAAPFTLSGEEKVQSPSPFPAGNGEEVFTLSTPKRVNSAAPFPRKGAETFTLSAEKVKAPAPFPAERVQDPSPFPPPPLDPPLTGGSTTPDLLPVSEGDPSSTSGSLPAAPERPLTPQQQAVRDVSALFEGAGIPVPPASQIGQWFKVLSEHGGLPALLALIEDLIGKGLQGMARPAAYVFACVKKQASGQFGTLPLTLAAGADETRRRQAEEISERSRRKAAAAR